MKLLKGFLKVDSVVLEVAEEQHLVLILNAAKNFGPVKMKKLLKKHLDNLCTESQYYTTTASINTTCKDNIYQRY